jgi:hypothetical protein
MASIHMSQQQVIAGLTVLDVGLMIGMLYIAGEMEGEVKVLVATALVAMVVIVGYRMLV